MTQQAPAFCPRIFTRAGDGVYYEDNRVIAAVDLHPIGEMMSITISEWTSTTPGQGHTETALRWLRSQGYTQITANGVGLIENGVGDVATAYWLHMHAKGLVDTLLDDDGRDITPTRPPALSMASNDASATLDLLIVVHPGSACGSANLNLGQFDARAARSALCHELNRWHGGVLVIDGSLSSELPGYPMLNEALLGALARAKDHGLTSARIQGCDNSDFDQAHAIGIFANEMGARLHGTRIKLTGAWYSADGGGCVGDVKRELGRRGIGADVAESVVWEPSDLGEDDVEPSTLERSSMAPSSSVATTSPTKPRRPGR